MVEQTRPRPGHAAVLCAAILALCPLVSESNTPAARSEQGKESPKVPEAVGWSSVRNQTIQGRCPPNNFHGFHYDFADRCSGVVRAWSGATADTKRNRLVLWGGGHNDYAGNELYAFDLQTLTLVRMNDPSDPVPVCSAAYSDGRPAARHTYGSFAYIAHLDKIFAFGGYVACPSGEAKGDTWLLDLPTLYSGKGNPWTRQDQGTRASPIGSNGVAFAVYDPITRLIFLVNTTEGLWSYNVTTNSYKRLNNIPTSLHSMAVLDPTRRLLITFGDGSARQTSLAHGSKYETKTIMARGCDELKNADSPGLAFDGILDAIVGWPNYGPTVYIYNPDTDSCQTQTFLESAPPDSAHSGPPPSSTGTFGRFQYFPSFATFVLMNDWDTEVHILRLGNLPPKSFQSDR